MKYTQAMPLDAMCLSSPWKRHDQRCYVCDVINNLLLISNINIEINKGSPMVWIRYCFYPTSQRCAFSMPQSSPGDFKHHMSRINILSQTMLHSFYHILTLCSILPCNCNDRKNAAVIILRYTWLRHNRLSEVIHISPFDTMRRNPCN